MLRQFEEYRDRHPSILMSRDGKGILQLVFPRALLTMPIKKMVLEYATVGLQLQAPAMLAHNS